MTQTINKSVCRGVAGKRVGKVKGVVIHNDAGSVYATAKHYLAALGSMNNNQLANGFAHYYIDRNTIVRTEDTYNQAWHTANSDGNANYIGYEVCQSIGASKADFLANEQTTLKQAAEDLKYYGLPANRNTVRLHREFVATACPHRSWELHGKSVNAVKDYFIAQIKKYMTEGGTTVATKDTRTPHYVLVGWYNKTSPSLKKLQDWLKKEKMGYKLITDPKNKNKVWLSVGYFGQSSTWKLTLEKYLNDNRWSYVVCYGSQVDAMIKNWK